MNTNSEFKERKDNLLRKYGLESVVRQFVRSISTTISQALRDSLKNFLSRK